ncbi:MAG: hypothetical protein GY765_34205 [bacterium]|nr:hypothetical protein [bacterium]
MAKRFIMTAFTKDRTGVVADTTKIIFDNKCNLEDTEMTQLEDEFVIMLVFTGDDTELYEKISADCRKLEREKEITAVVRELQEAPYNPLESYTTHTIYSEGIDQTGIVYKISLFLAEHSTNISKLISRRRLSPESGTTIYAVEIEVEVPVNTSLDELESGLSELGQTLHIDLRLDN